MKALDQDLPIDDALIDRVVDGGMSPEELRGALERLERDPGGWKRCVVAFLEAQVLNESFRALGQAENYEPKGQSLAPPRVTAKRSGHRWLRAAAAAAMVMASFAIGWMSHGARTGAPARDSLAGDPGIRQPSPQNDVAESTTGSSPSDLPEDDRSRLPDEAYPMIRAVATVRVGPEGSPAEVPVLAGPGINEEWLAQQPPAVSEHGQAVLASQGYQVEQQRRYFTTVLADGRRVAVPVDHVRIQYTGSEPL
jgi:hypothetical protein